jgi:hypothetical protein
MTRTICPIEWAKAIVVHQDHLTARTIAETHAREFIGTDGATKNPHSAFYKRALKWIKLHAAN